MKRLFSILAIAGTMAFGTVNANAFTTTTTAATTTVATVTQEEEAAAPAEEDLGFHQELKKRFIEGGPGFMGIVLLCLILGLAIAIERIIFLNLSTTNTKKLTQNVEDALASGGIEAAKEVCRNTKGPVASIFYQGLDRADEDIDAAEKAVVAYGGVQMGQLEKNVSWISLFIALAPMLGFMGTVIGMIQAFDKIEAAGDMQPSLVAGGIKVALLTTVFGLIVAIILQIFYNYIIAKIDEENENSGAYNGKDLPGVSKHNVTVNLGYTYNKYKAIVSHTYRSSAYAANDFGNSFSQKQEAYNSTDVSLGYNYKNIEVFAKIQNLFDEANGIWIKDDNIYPVNFERTYNFGAKIKF